MCCQMQKSDRIEDPTGLGCEVAVKWQRPPHLPARRPQTEQAERDIVFERIARKQRNDLIGPRQSKMRALVGRELRNVRAEQLDLARIRPQVTADLVEQGCLAGAIRTDDQAAFTRPHRQRYVLRYRKPPERLVQVDYL